MASTINAKNTSTGLVMTPDATGQLELQTADTTRMTITSGGNVGIGTSSPSAKLHVSGSSSGNSNIRLTNTFTNGRSWELNPYASGVSDVPFTIRDVTAGADRLTIDSSGLVGIGTNSPSNSGGVLNIVYNSSNPITIKNTGVTSNAGQWAISLGAADNFIVQNNNGAGVQVTYGATSWSSYSDERLKTVIGTYTDALAGVSKLQPVKFTWKADESNKPQVGILAQSIQDVVPEAIDSVTMTPEDTTEYLTVRYTELIPLLTAAIQELKAELDTVKAELAELKGAA